jgi:hypothetical protein
LDKVAEHCATDPNVKFAAIDRAHAIGAEHRFGAAGADGGKCRLGALLDGHAGVGSDGRRNERATAEDQDLTVIDSELRRSSGLQVQEAAGIDRRVAGQAVRYDVFLPAIHDRRADSRPGIHFLQSAAG